MNLLEDINIKSIVYGIIIAAVCILLGHRFNDLFYPFAALGLLYAGYCAKDIKQGLFVGCVTAIPIAILSLLGYLGSFSGFYKTVPGMIVLIIIVLLVGALVGFIGALAKRDRMKAIENYEKKNKKGKKKKKK